MAEAQMTFLSPFHQRLIAEKEVLDDNLGKLSNFLTTEEFFKIANEQQILLRIQVQAMRTYSQCLTERLGLLQ